MKKDFELVPLSAPKKTQQKQENVVEADSVPTIRMFVDLTIEMTEKIRDYAYWERLTQKETMLKAVEQFIKDNPVESRPDSVKNRKRPGKKRKN